MTDSSTMKKFNVMYGVGTGKYLVNFHDGVKTHTDGSPFFDVKIFTNRKKFNYFISELISSGYKMQ